MLQPVAIPEAYKVPKMFVAASENFHATHLFKEYWKLEPLVIPHNLMTMNYMKLIFASLLVHREKYGSIRL